MTIMDSLPAAPRVGETLGRYTVERVEPLPEMQGTLVLLRHELGARHAHVIRADDNSAFGVTFRSHEVTGLRNVGELVETLDRKRA